MPHARKTSDEHSGTGVLRIRGRSEGVQYLVEANPAGLRQGHHTLRGSLATTPAFASDAFKHGDGVLTAEGGASYRLKMLAYSEGSDRVYVEFRI